MRGKLLPRFDSSIPGLGRENQKSHVMRLKIISGNDLFEPFARRPLQMRRGLRCFKLHNLASKILVSIGVSVIKVFPLAGFFPKTL
jgi:hypothetical protein